MCWNNPLKQFETKGQSPQIKLSLPSAGLRTGFFTQPQHIHLSFPPIAKGRQSGKRHRQLNKLEAVIRHKCRGLVQYLLIICKDTKHDLKLSIPVRDPVSTHGLKFYLIQIECVNEGGDFSYS